MKKHVEMLLYTLLGNAMLAFAVCAIVVPRGIMMGGTSGIALAVREFVPAPLSLISGCVCVALFLLGWAFLGKEFAAKSLISTLVYPLIMALFERIPLEKLFAGEDMIICTILCSALVGVGIGLVVRVGGSTGGMDIPPCILQKYRGIPVGKSLFVFDGLIILAQVLLHGSEGILYAALNVVLTSVIVDRTIVSGEQKIEIIIISPEYQRIRHEILHTVNCGATMLQIETGYEGKAQQAILSVVYAGKYPAIRDVALRIDPEAFIVTADVKNVSGEGYTRRRKNEILA